MPKKNACRICILAVVLAIVGVGCSSADDPGNANSARASHKVVTPEAARLAASMVKAVGGGDGNASVDVRFEITQRPEVGKPVDISLAFIPTARLERLYARFQAGTELELSKGAETEQIARPVLGAPIMHTLTVTPRRDGIFTVTAVVLVDTENDSVSRNFSIPLIAGTGLPEWSPKQGVAHTAP